MRLRKILFFGLILTLQLAATSSRAQAPQPSEYQLKSAFIFNFAKFIDWPTAAFTDPKSPFIIGVLGDNPFGNDFEQMVAGKKINDRTISIQTLRTASEATNCQILFVSVSEKKRFHEIIQSLHDAPVLTVSETDGFIEAGGMINFVEEAGKIRFQIDDVAAKATGLKISSKLLTLAIPAPH